ncbi:MAG: transcriptional regulator [Micavibrio sp.]|nr:transcriptional regulator [Micavibrio sp.]|tara:strand:- start:1272 stop:1889 length:618 start_codon:yes stop_codon:yes gene_type:complete
MQTLITGKQCRAARAMLGWTIDDLAENSGLARSVILRLEKEETNIRHTSLSALLKTFSKANIDFIGHHGVSEKRDSVELLRGENALEKLWENIFFTLGDTGGEILISNANKNLAAYRDNLKANNITKRLLSCEGDTNFIMPKECYRWLPKEVFAAGNSTYIYDGKVAYQLWNEQIIILIHSNDAFAAEKKRFEYMWETALIPSNV